MSAIRRGFYPEREGDDQKTPATVPPATSSLPGSRPSVETGESEHKPAKTRDLRRAPPTLPARLSRRII